MSGIPYSMDAHRKFLTHGLCPPIPPCPNCAKNECNSLRQQMLIKNMEIETERCKKHVDLLEILIKSQLMLIGALQDKLNKKEEREKVSQKLYDHLVREDEWGCITGGAIGSKWAEEKEKAGEEKKE